MRRLLSAITVFVFAFGVVAPGADAAPRFTSSVVSRAELDGEPGIEIDDHTSPPTLYVVVPQSVGAPTLVWRSTNGGRTFQRMKPSRGTGGDSDATVDANRTLYISDLTDNGGGIPISVSTNGARSYLRKVDVGDSGGSYDRQWTASNGAGRLVVIATNTNSGSVQSWVTTNSARSFRGPYDAASLNGAPGPVIAGPNGSYYFAYSGDSGITVASSRDGARWSRKVAAPGHAAVLFPVVAMDDDWNMYVTWSDISGLLGLGTAPVYVTRSSNLGRTWTRPQAISPTATDVFGTIPSAVFPWIVAGAKGRVAVSYLQARQLAGPDLASDLGGPQTTWDLVVAESTNATSSSPAWSRTVAARSIHQGSVCTFGLACVGPQNFTGIGNVPTPFDRRLLDFFGAGVDRAGRVYVAYNKDRPITSGDPNDLIFAQMDILVARQVGGTRLR